MNAPTIAGSHVHQLVIGSGPSTSQLGIEGIDADEVGVSQNGECW